jgi:hypothetical protein
MLRLKTARTDQEDSPEITYNINLPRTFHRKVSLEIIHCKQRQFYTIKFGFGSFYSIFFLTERLLTEK